MGAGASAKHDGSGLRELEEKAAKVLGPSAVSNAADSLGAYDTNGGRDENRAWTVSVGSSALRKNKMEDAEIADLRSGGRCKTDSALVYHRRESTQELTEEDKEFIAQRDEFLKGRVRRGSLFLGEVSEETLQTHFSEKANVHFYARQGNCKPFAESELDHIGAFVPDQEKEKVESELKIGVSCTKGRKGATDTAAGQDNFSVTHMKDGYKIYTVMDGHGKSGHNVSYRTVRTLPYYIATSVFYPGDMDKCLKDAFNLCQQDLMGNALTQQYDAQGSGSTVTCCVVKDDTAWSAHCGDSRVVIAYADSTVCAETADHKPQDEPEKERIEAAGGEVRSFKYEDDWTVHRMFIKGRNYPGLCMSRSFGDDCVKEHGVSAEPDVSMVKLDMSKRPLVILASDGVWEFLETGWVVRAIWKALAGKGMLKCAKKLTREAKHRWKEEEGDYCDDITALLVDLKLG